MFVDFLDFQVEGCFAVFAPAFEFLYFGVELFSGFLGVVGDNCRFLAFKERFKRFRIKRVGEIVCSGVEVEKSSGGIGIYLVAEVVNAGEDKVFFGLGCADCDF